MRQKIEALLRKVPPYSPHGALIYNGAIRAVISVMIGSQIYQVKGEGHNDWVDVPKDVYDLIEDEFRRVVYT